MRRFLLCAGVTFFATVVAIAQTTPVTYSEDFQSYTKSKKPQGWQDGKVGDLNAKSRGYFKTAIDPLQADHNDDGHPDQGNGPSNIVFGTTKSTGSDGDEQKGNRIGLFSTYVDKTFSASGRFEFLGRMIEMDPLARMGLVVLSGYPVKDQYYLVAGKKNAQGKLTFQLTAFGAGTPAGTIDSGFVMNPGKWYRFRIAVDDVNNTTAIRARFWLDGTTEPSAYQLDAVDASAARLKSGHIGMWAGGRGDSDDGNDDGDRSRGAYIDDLAAHSPSDTTPPVITFYESGTKLDPTTTPAFNRDVKIEIRVTDDLSTFTYTAQLDGNPYVSLTTIGTEGLHTLTVHAVDAPGNVRDATLKFLIDKTKPVVTLLANGNPLVSGTVFGKDVTLTATVQDASSVTTAAKLDNVAVTLPAAVAQEQSHQFDVTATDIAGNSATASASFIVDKTPPVIAIQANGQALADGASFRVNVTLTWTATDLTLNTVSATLDNGPVQSGFTVTTGGQHTLAVTATDKANHSTTATRTFYISKTAPEVTLLANGVAFVKDKTYNTAVKFTVTVNDSVPTTTAITVDNNSYTQGTPVTGDGLHSVQVVVTDVSSLSTTVGPFNFTIDTTPPTITMTESGQPFQDGSKFTRNVLPIVTATDALTPNPIIVVTLDGKPYPVNTPIDEEKADHVISATATDAGGNSSGIGPFHFMLDKSKPVVTIVNAATGQPFPADARFNVPVSVKVTVVDVTQTTVAATLDGTPFTLGAPAPQADGSVVYTPAPISSEGAHTLSVVATDQVAFSNDPAIAAFTIDTTPPHIVFTDPVPDSTVSTITVTVAGTADDAQTITINGQPAAVNTASKTFTLTGFSLLEGKNEIDAVAFDAVGNRGTATMNVDLDTRAPQIAINSPAPDSCADTTALQVSGTVSDAHIGSVSVTVGSYAPVTATIDASGHTWTATVPVPDEGKKLITVTATDTSAHSTSVSSNVVIDRTAPAITITESGAPFVATVVNRAVSLFVRATDLDPAVAVSATLDGAAYASGTSIASEGSHTVAVTATDCASHVSTKSVQFTIDLTPPAIRNLNPANGATVGSMPQSLRGSTDSDAVSVAISGTTISATPAADGTFTLAAPFAEGSNRFTLIATDRAGNHASFDYTVTIKTVAPSVEIRESGLPIAPGALYNRTVTPAVRSSDLTATISATLDGAAFTSGTTISSDGDHKLSATATDTLGHSGSADVTFTIDRTPPAVKITAPAAGTVQTDHVQVRGSAGDAVSASVNGQPVTLAADGTFVVDSLLLDIGTNSIVATGRDRAGNVGRDEVVVVRDDTAAAVLITYPPDRSLTNRPTTDVIGRILTLGRGTTVSVGTRSVPVDPTGGFRVSGYALTEGENTITATSTAANGVQSSASTHVTADFTPPSLTILESGQPLTDGARFATQAVISLQTADSGGGAVTAGLIIDGTKTTTVPFTITTAGGHSITAVATDLAGNQTRADRTLFVGNAAASTGCQLDSFDPADGSVVLANAATLVGRSGGAIGVKVNGVAAVVADGSFSARVELPVEGPNAITIVCTDAAGNPTGTPATITLQRVTGDPSITIAAPNENFASAQDSIAASGTVGPGVVSADVNGVAATITGTDTTTSRPFTVAAVRLAPGLNIVVAHGRNAAGRVATASRRGIYYKDAPAVTITSPTPNTTTGTPSITVSGTYTNLDPTTLVAGTTQAQFVRASDTTGTFTAANVPLTSGTQTLVASGRDRLNRLASASVVVTLATGSPSIAITQPADQSYFGPGSTTVTVNGTFQAAAGASVDVNGTAATVTGATYTATANFATLAGGITPIVARVTEPAGASAAAAVVVTQLTDAPKVLESFPAPNALGVDNGALLLVLFSQPMDGGSVASAFRLEDSTGAPVSGTSFLDKDVLTFAPAALLTPGSSYTLRVSASAKNLAGTQMAADYSSPFTVVGSAPSTAPSVTPIAAAICGQTIAVNGTATPGARVRLESGQLTLDTSADATGKFTFTWPISGQSGFALARVLVVGSDGSLSPAAELQVRVDCTGPSVLNAAYDRAANKVTIQFSEPIDPATATVGTGNAILLTLDDGTSITGSATVSGAVATITPSADLSAKTFSLTVSTAIKDLVGNNLVAAFSQTFSVTGAQPVAGDGSGFISGEVYDATTGRPLSGAAITLDVPSQPVTTSTDARGRYVARVAEGAHTIKAGMSGYTSVWREIIVPAGAGVVPIDIRLTRRGDPKTSNGAPIAMTHGGDTAVTKTIDLSVPSGGLAAGSQITLTSVGAQALTGLLPLGWSPIASAEVTVGGSDDSAALTGAQLTSHISAADVTSAAQNLSAVRYDSSRDEWRVIVAVANIGSDGTVLLPISTTGAYALVYPDKAAGLTVPPLPVAGDVLRGVPASPDTAPPLVKRDFVLDPPIVLPSGRATATLRIEGGVPAAFPSGTAVQAYIDEELRLADGSSLLDPPFATDLLLYRTLAGDLAVANFHLAPSAKAAQVVLDVGVDHIHIQPYPGRLDRGTLIGSEGGRVPADDKVTIDIPSGSVPEPLRATATSMSSTDLASVGSVPGFQVVGGFHLTLERVTQPPPVDLNGDGIPDPVAPPELFVPARVTFSVDASKLPTPNAQVILAELLDSTPYGGMLRLAVPMTPVDPSQTSTPAIRFTSKLIDRSVLPVDGVVREGRYVVLAAQAPIAYATGTVHFLTTTGRLTDGALVTATALGVRELSRSNGIYNIPVPATPAPPFTLVPRHTSTGDGAAYVNPAQVAADAIVPVDLAIVPQPPVLSSVVVLVGDPPSQGTLTAGATTNNVALTTNVRASFTPAIDPASVTAGSITVTDSLGATVSGSAAADGTTAVVWTLTAGVRLNPNSRYLVAVSPAIRGTNGAALGRGASFALTTVTQLTNTAILRERIRITIPDANGVSLITGDAGALPAGWQAVAIRRAKDFIVRYQATAAADGSFSFSIGNGGDPADKIGIGDLIDLQVVNSAGNLAGIFALTPFVTADGKGFVVPAGAAVTYTTPEGITLSVPAGAFDVPTVINVAAATKNDFLDIPSLEAENEYAASVNITFDGKSNVPLTVELPVPAGFDTAGKQFILAQKGMSVRGPRLAVIDLMRVSGGKFTNAPDSGQSTRSITVFNPGKGVNQTLTGSKFTKYLQMLQASGIFTVLDIRQPVGGSVGWAVMEGLQAGYDLTWDIFASYYVPYVQVFERGGALLPIVTGKKFTVVGTDPATGLQAFSRTYDPIPIGDPGTVTPIAPAQQDEGGPYPVFGGPFRVELLNLDVEDIVINSIANFSVRLSGGNVTVSPGATPLGGDTQVELLNISNGTFTSGSASSPLTLPANAGNQIALLIETHDADPSAPISVVFNEPVFVGPSTNPDDVDTFFHGLIKVEQAEEPAAGTPPSFTDITPQVTFTVDSGNRRINIVTSGALQRDAVYRITLQPGIADVLNNAAGLTLGQGTVDNGGNLTPVGGGNPLHLVFHVRKPAGALATLTAPVDGLIHGMDLSGNVLFLAMDGGLLSYDMSNPAGTPAPLGSVPGPPNGIASHLSVFVDRHNRVYATALQGIVGVFRSYRVEDFLGGGTSIPIKGMTIINWKLGFSQNIGLPSNTVLSDVPESIPFRIKVLLQDDETNFDNRDAFIAGTGAANTGSYPGDVQSFTVSVSKDSTPYKMQRITVENLTLDMRWSADATEGGPATITNIIARSADKLRLLRNQKTFAVVAHLGYGIGIYDANAIESNRAAGLTPTSPGHITEKLVLTAGKISRDCPNATPDYGIVENYLNTDAELRGDPSGDIYSYAPDPYRGVLDLHLTLPSPTTDGTRDDSCEQRPNPNAGGLLFRSAPDGHAVPRIQALTNAFASAAGRQPINHFFQVGQYHWSISAADNAKGLRGTVPNSAADRDYLLVAGYEYGLIVLDINGNPPVVSSWPLDDPNIADIIWVPGGVLSVRVYQSANIAIVTDKNGKAIVVDLSRIDERWDASGNPVNGLFPTAKKALAGANSPDGVGSDDPRILWKSESGVVSGVLAPVFDPDTGMVFAGSITGRTVQTLSAIDPRLRVRVNLGDAGGLSDVGGIVPLGIAPPPDIQNKINALPPCAGNTTQCRENASLGAFRLEVALPGNMTDAITSNELRLAVESERVAGAITEQTPDGFPRAHLRKTRRDGSPEFPNRVAANFKLTRIVPDQLKGALKNQSGYNRFVSPWIVAIADPRASQQYNWSGATPQQKADAGCESCDRPKNLSGLGESDGVYELFTNGRFIAVRPELTSATQTIFDGSQYAYLGTQNRLVGRFSTIMADVVRPTDSLVAAQNPDTATGMIQETLFLHSGEVQSSSLDLNAEGRAEFNVLFDRTYRSRTIGGSALGQGWDSALFQRLRALPSGDVEYRDGAEVWRFRANAAANAYDSPKGLFLKLSRTTRGWKLIDQKWRVTEFDDLGRVIATSDEFYNPAIPDSGNIIRYVYDDNGRLAQIVDPVDRVSSLTYWSESDAGAQGAYPGLLKEISDWRNRTIDYAYDPAAGTLTSVKLPDVPNTTGSRPVLQYTYTAAGSSYNDVLELRPDLASITEPQEVATGGAPRVKFTYDLSTGAMRDHVVRQDWGTGENATMTYNSPTSVTTVDVLGQTRNHTLSAQPKDYFSDRAHVLSMVETAVVTSAFPFGQLPSALTVGSPSTSALDRTRTYTYSGEGQFVTTTLDGVRSMTYTYNDVRPEAPGLVVASETTNSQGGSPDVITETIDYQQGGNASTYVNDVDRNGIKVVAPDSHRNNLSPQGQSESEVARSTQGSQKQSQAQTNSVQATKDCSNDGLLKDLLAIGGVDPNSAGANVKVKAAPANDSQKHRRGLKTQLDRGAGIKTDIDYPSPDQVVETDSRGIVTTEDLDAVGHVLHIGENGGEASDDERYEYDATGRVAKSIRKQGDNDITTTYAYDAVGRPTSVSVDHVADTGTATTTSSYNFANRTITTNYPGGAVTVTKLDTIGRVISRETATGSSPINVYMAYDLADNLVYQTDLLTATAMAYDGHGRRVAIMYSDGTTAKATYDAWGNPTALTSFDTAGTTIAESSLAFTPDGQLQSASKKIDAAQHRDVQVAWDGGSRVTGMSASGPGAATRATHSQYDEGGRLLESETGEGTATSVSTSFVKEQVSSYSGALPQNIARNERIGGTYSVAVQYNANSDAVVENIGGLEWQRHFDQDGNVTSSSMPNRGATVSSFDARGSLTQESLPGGGTIAYNYDGSGSLSRYTDPTSEATNITTDLLGRPLSRIFKDGTQETIVWEGRRVKSITDRNGRLQSFTYNGKGQIAQMTGSGGVVLETFDYDPAGRVIKRANDGASIEYSDFDLDGNPATTVQSRFRNGTLVDRYEQHHQWNVHGERTHWSMPSYSGFSSSAPWTSSVDQSFDVVGNLTTVQRTLFSGTSTALLQADYRNTGRPDQRTVTTATGVQIDRRYTYDNSTGLLSQLLVTAGGQTIAGSAVTYDGLQKSKAQLLGVSGGARASQWTYDARGRLQSTILARDTGSTPESEQLSPADFRLSLTRPAETPVDPPSVLFVESAAGHKIDSVQRGGVAEQFSFTAGDRTQDGRFVYAYDAKGRLASVTERTPTAQSLRRIRYDYDSTDRLVGRTAEYAIVSSGTPPAPGDWKLEDRPEVLASDGLPADSTFVWDPLADRLVAIYKSGASQTPAIDGNGGLVRQIIHGGFGMDDPIEVAVADSSAPAAVAHMYPVFDEGASGSLQVIVGDNGQLLSRSIAGGPYGEDESILTCAAVDRIQVRAQRGTDGTLTQVVITLRATEKLAAQSLTSGVRLAAVDASGAVIHASTATPSLADDSTVQWTLSATDWNALVDPAPVNGKVPQALSVAATSSLRAAGWNASSSILPAPAWATQVKPVFSSPALPVEVRESLTSLSGFVASAPVGQAANESLYEVRSLAALGSPRTGPAVGASDPERQLVASGFHSHPFQEPLTGHDYVRARWFDTQNGVWLTPDPMGYVDSSNLYAYAGGDPVNGRDPRGQYEADFHYGLTWFLAEKAGFTHDVAKRIAEGAEQPDRDWRAPVHQAVKAGVAGDRQAADILREWHFPKPDLYTGEVVPCSADARRKIEAGIRDKNLDEFAQGLHPFEDSWAHQGTPPLGYAGHADNRGGMLRHDADMTYKHPSDAMAAAEATYAAIEAYAFVHMDRRDAPNKPAPWPQIKPEVEDFVHQSTKAGKRAWFNARGIDLEHTMWKMNLWVGDEINLPEGNEAPKNLKQKAGDWTMHKLEGTGNAAGPPIAKAIRKGREVFDWAVQNWWW